MSYHTHNFWWCFWQTKVYSSGTICEGARNCKNDCKNYVNIEGSSLISLHIPERCISSDVEKIMQSNQSLTYMNYFNLVKIIKHFSAQWYERKDRYLDIGHLKLAIKLKEYVPAFKSRFCYDYDKFASLIQPNIAPEYPWPLIRRTCKWISSQIIVDNCFLYFVTSTFCSPAQYCRHGLSLCGSLPRAWFPKLRIEKTQQSADS